MSDCRRTVERLTPYVDDALEPPERVEVEKHLNACPPCRTAAEDERAGRTVLRECACRLREQSLPPGLRSRCETLARTHGRRSLFPWRSRIVTVSLVAILIVFTSSAVLSIATK